jgi:hypothetical protein
LRAWIVPPRVAESQKGCWRKIAIALSDRAGIGLILNER